MEKCTGDRIMRAMIGASDDLTAQGLYRYWHGRVCCHGDVDRFIEQMTGIQADHTDRVYLGSSGTGCSEDAMSGKICGGKRWRGLPGRLSADDL